VSTGQMHMLFRHKLKTYLFGLVCSWDRSA